MNSTAELRVIGIQTEIAVSHHRVIAVSRSGYAYFAPFGRFEVAFPVGD